MEIDDLVNVMPHGGVCGVVYERWSVLDSE